MERRNDICSKKKHMVISSLIILSLVITGTLVFTGDKAGASSKYVEPNCTSSCHLGAYATCVGCHFHGAYDFSDYHLNLSATTDRPSYKPGDTVKVTINGGSNVFWGWVGADLYDGGIACVLDVYIYPTQPEVACTNPYDINNWLELAKGTSGLGFPLTLSHPTPSNPGTYKWVATYISNYSDPGFPEDGGLVNNIYPWNPPCETNQMNPPCSIKEPYNQYSSSNHARDYFYTNSFVVTNGSIINLSPASIDFGSVRKGSSVKRTIKVQNLGLSVLKVTGIARASGTSTEYTWSPSPSTTKPMSVKPGSSSTLTVTYTPIDTNTDAGALVIKSNDTVTPQKNLAISGNGF
jgi:hypothetical protein